MADIAMIGGADSVLLAKAAGIDAYDGSDAEHTKKLIAKLAKSNVKVIFITEDLYVMAQETIEKYRTLPFPTIIPIPDSSGSKGVGKSQISANVEKAIGMDILFSDKE